MDASGFYQLLPCLKTVEYFLTVLSESSALDDDTTGIDYASEHIFRFATVPQGGGSWQRNKLYKGLLGFPDLSDALVIRNCLPPLV